MNTLHKNLADIRELRHEEIDLTSGAYSMETTYHLTFQTIQTSDGRTITVPGDAGYDAAFD
jgi:hypothetical protein